MATFYADIAPSDLTLNVRNRTNSDLTHGDVRTRKRPTQQPAPKPRAETTSKLPSCPWARRRCRNSGA